MTEVNKTIDEYKLEGFQEFKNFKNDFKSLPTNSAVYVFVYKKRINRLIGSSNILKIGETLNLKKRMARYFKVQNIEDIKDKPKRQTAYRLRVFFDKHADEKITLLYKNHKNSSKEKLRNKERELLENYLEKHREVPPLNMGLR